MATLTGASLVGLGKYPSGLFSNSDDLSMKIKKSADRTGDRVWELPCTQIISMNSNKFCRYQNIGGRYGGAITAAAFLNFTKDQMGSFGYTGTAWETGQEKGSTGRLLTLADFCHTNKFEIYRQLLLTREQSGNILISMSISTGAV